MSPGQAGPYDQVRAPALLGIRHLACDHRRDVCGAHLPARADSMHLHRARRRHDNDHDPRACRRRFRTAVEYRARRRGAIAVWRGRRRHVPPARPWDAGCPPGGSSASGLPSTAWRSAARSTAPSRTVPGNAASIARTARPPRACSSCTAASASNTGIRARRNAAAAVDLPMPMPPVRPRTIIVSAGPRPRSWRSSSST